VPAFAQSLHQTLDQVIGKVRYVLTSPTQYLMVSSTVAGVTSPMLFDSLRDPTGWTSVAKTSRVRRLLVWPYHLCSSRQAAKRCCSTRGRPVAH
jgi:hypothetical protein